LNPGTAGPWRPPQWSQTPGLFIAVSDAQNGEQTFYVFDGALRAEHEQHSVITLNPVQTGAAISDHAYTVPARLVVEIAMSDAMQSFIVGQWSDGPSKSASAYQTLVALQRQRQVLQVATRLRQYDQMLISEVRTEETVGTRFALKAIVTFTEIITASVESTSSGVSFDPALPQTTGQTVTGQVRVSPVPENVQAQNSVVGPLAQSSSTVPGAGKWSSAVTP
jgi:hypothetical protein